MIQLPGVANKYLHSSNGSSIVLSIGSSVTTQLCSTVADTRPTTVYPAMHGTLDVTAPATSGSGSISVHFEF